MDVQSEEYSVPEDEQQRLRTLRNYRILDSPEESPFDNLTEMATNVFDVPISLICLVDEDRQWFKSVTGLDVRETERKCSFCNHVLLSREIMTIEDTHEDERVDGNRLVVEDPHIRSYAGAPLKTEDGKILGTFCILDQKPRSFSSRDLIILESLATVTMEQIELRFRNERRRIVNKKLRGERDRFLNQLKQAQTEKDELLHRIKNNFSQVRSMLNLERSRAKHTDELEALESAEARIFCFTAIYEQLDRTRHDQIIESRDYLKSIVKNASKVFRKEVDDTTVSLDLEDVTLPGDFALKFGIVLNELITNTYEHVLIPGLGQRLNISFEQDGDTYCLMFSDDGPGLPEPALSEDRSSGGLNLIQSMIEYADTGTFEYKNEEGSTFIIQLPADRG